MRGMDIGAGASSAGAMNKLREIGDRVANKVSPTQFASDVFGTLAEPARRIKRVSKALGN
jgi:hypothetical protein